jgi:hypothetical protein
MFVNLEGNVSHGISNLLFNPFRHLILIMILSISVENIVKKNQQKQTHILPINHAMI